MFFLEISLLFNPLLPFEGGTYHSGLARRSVRAHEALIHRLDDADALAPCDAAVQRLGVVP
jgi:hypothetical protein